MTSASLVLCYHAVSPSWEAELSVRPDRFSDQIELMLKRGYRPLRFTDLTEADADDRVFAVTFDDAFRSVYTFAAPILERLGVPASLFVPTDYVEARRPLQWPGVDRWLQTPHAHEMCPMSWEEIRELQDAGWEIGSHTCSHPLLTLLSDEALASEMVQSREICESRLGTPCRSIAYPYGNVDERVAGAAAQAGYRAAGALPGQFADRDPLQWPRIGVYNVDDDRRFRLKVSLAVSRLRASALWAVYERARPRSDGSASVGSTGPRPASRGR